MANMLHKSAPYLLNVRCLCPRCVSGPDRRIERRAARRKEERAWLRDYEAGEYTNPVAQLHWDWKRIDLAEENESNLGFTGYTTASPYGDGDDF